MLITTVLDLSTVDDLRAPLLERVDTADARPIELDLTGVGYLSSSGVALLLQAMRRAEERGRDLTLVAGAGGGPARVLELSGLPHTLRRAGD